MRPWRCLPRDGDGGKTQIVLRLQAAFLRERRAERDRRATLGSWAAAAAWQHHARTSVAQVLKSTKLHVAGPSRLSACVLTCRRAAVQPVDLQEILMDTIRLCYAGGVGTRNAIAGVDIQGVGGLGAMEGPCVRHAREFGVPNYLTAASVSGRSDMAA